LIRGEIYTAAARGAYTGKPRPVVIVQDDRFDALESVTICPFTTTAVEAPLMRIRVDPSDQNGISEPSSIMVDKLTTIPKANLSERVGLLEADHLLRLNRSLVVFLGLASS
jgi:mRNA interferase MazF